MVPIGRVRTQRPTSSRAGAIRWPGTEQCGWRVEPVRTENAWHTVTTHPTGRCLPAKHSTLIAGAWHGTEFSGQPLANRMPRLPAVRTVFTGHRSPMLCSQKGTRSRLVGLSSAPLLQLLAVLLDQLCTLQAAELWQQLLGLRMIRVEESQSRCLAISYLLRPMSTISDRKRNRGTICMSADQVSILVA